MSKIFGFSMSRKNDMTSGYSYDVIDLEQNLDEETNWILLKEIKMALNNLLSTYNPPRENKHLLTMKKRPADPNLQQNDEEFNERLPSRLKLRNNDPYPIFVPNNNDRFDEWGG